MPPIEPVEETSVKLNERPESSGSITSFQQKINQRKKSMPNYASRSIVGTNKEYKDVIARKQFEKLQTNPKYIKEQTAKRGNGMFSIQAIRKNPIVTSRKQ